MFFLTIVLLILATAMSVLDKLDFIKKSKNTLVRLIPTIFIILSLTLSIVNEIMRENSEKRKSNKRAEEFKETMDSLNTSIAVAKASIDKLGQLQNIARDINSQSSTILTTTRSLYDDGKKLTKEKLEVAERNLHSAVHLILEINNTLMYSNLLIDSANGIREMRYLRSQISDLIKREMGNPVLKRNDFMKECWYRLDSILMQVSFPLGGYDASHLSDTKRILALSVNKFTRDATEYLNSNNNSFKYPPSSPRVIQHICRSVTQYSH